MAPPAVLGGPYLGGFGACLALPWGLSDAPLQILDSVRGRRGWGYLGGAVSHHPLREVHSVISGYAALGRVGNTQPY